MSNNSAKGSAQQPYIKSDEIKLDTSSSPWMKYAKEQLDKGVREVVDKEFYSDLRKQSDLQQSMRSLEEKISNFGSESTLLGNKSGVMTPENYKLTNKKFENPSNVLDRIQSNSLQKSNPEIVKYLETVKTDPLKDKKNQSWTLAPTHKSGDNIEITAWCAAFVNWCLKQAGAPRLGYATADSWLRFGTPVAHPVYGAIVIIKPSRSTGSTTGHVAFFERFEGENVRMLGGNQNDKVGSNVYKGDRVLGYRWPTTIDDYLLAGSGVIA